MSLQTVFKLCIANLVEDNSSITVTTENSSYPKSNLYNQRPGKPFIFTDTTGRIIIDFGTAQSVNFIALIGHNLDNDVTFQMNSSDSWGSPPVNQEMTVTSGNMYKELDSSESYRYASLVIGSNNTTTAKIGELVIGSLVDTGLNYQWGADWENEEKNLTHETDYGQEWNYYLFGKREWNVNFLFTDDQVTTFYGYHKTLKGKNIPFCFLDPYGLVAYIRWKDKNKFKLEHNDSNKNKTKFSEVPLGKDIS